eukprot:TRINITY_DN117_c0_g1_i1.p1 TRINITY_DN117_c0_g1~~TRINITY_DN117_c0_g1_i1.p1  ORF type:complete len:840 (-),score=227.93 TRINITY_DN117_c0_g1_i1:199-2718(-)
MSSPSASLSVVLLLLLGCASFCVGFTMDTTCSSELDLMLILDASGSVQSSGWRQIIKFSQAIVDRFEISDTAARVGAVQFSSTSTSRLEFGLSSDAATVKSGITSMSYPSRARTDIAKGFELANDEMFSSSRSDANLVYILLTDGVQNEPEGRPSDPNVPASVAKTQGVEIFVVGVGADVSPQNLNSMASDPYGDHVFYAQNFDSLLDLISSIVDKACSHIECPSVSPDHGPPAGGTTVTIVGDGLEDTGKGVVCQFAREQSPGKFVDGHVECVSPAGDAGTSVVLEISLDGGVTFTSDKCQFTYDEFKEDPCAQWDSDCAECISHPFCGWCSSPVTHPDGSSGSQCAGFNHDENSGEQPFVCVGTYHTEECVPGYECNIETATCEITEPGDGMDVEECTSKCGVGSIYKCNNETNTCEKCEDGTPGCVDHTSCKDSCEVTDPSPTPSSSTPPEEGEPGTPEDLVNTIWRGLQVNNDYDHGEFQMEFDEETVTVQNPDGKLWKATVNSTKTQGEKADILYFTDENGDVFRAIRDGKYNGELQVMTLSSSVANGSLPGSFAETFTWKFGVEIWTRCINDQTCHFRWVDPMSPDVSQSKRSILQSSPPPMSDTDNCSQFSSCDECIGQSTCGWCNNPVVYEDGSVGSNCAGFNEDSTKKPFVCKGIYSTDSCEFSQPPDVYFCDESAMECIKAAPQNGTSIEACEASCNADSLNPKNVTPAALQGTWRGLRVEDDYPYGEFNCKFGKSDVVMSSDNGTILFQGAVSYVKDQLWVISDNEVMKGIWQLSYGPVTKFVSWGLNAIGLDVPSSFSESMNSDGMTTYFLTSCDDKLADAGTCSFE